MTSHRYDDPVGPGGDDGIQRSEFLRRALLSGVALSGVGGLLGEAAIAEARGGTLARSAASTTTLTYRTRADIEFVDPAFSSSVADNIVEHQIFEGLLGYEPTPKPSIVNQLVDEWEPNAHGTQYRFKLKQGVMFHKGFGEMKASDVQYTIYRVAGLTKPNINSAYAGDWVALDQVKVTGPYEGVIMLKYPYVPLLTQSIPYVSGLIVSQKAVEKLGKKFNTNPVGTGPYVFTSWTPGQKVVMTKFADWHGGANKLAFDEIVLDIIASEETTAVGLSTGELNSAAIDPVSVKQFQNNSGFLVSSQSTLNYAWIGMNVLHPNLTNINVRQAIRYAIDVPSILETAYMGEAIRANAVLAPHMPVGYWKNAPVYNQDIPKAKAFLAKAPKVTAPLTITAESSQLGATDITQIIEANLASIGLKANITLVPTLAPAKSNKTSLQVFYEYFQGIAPDPVSATEWFRCNQLGQWNFMYWCNPTFSKLDVNALSQTNRAQRSATYIREQAIWDQNCNTVWLAYPNEITATKTGIKPAFYPWGDPALWAYRMG